jgi:hypothetical protein
VNSQFVRLELTRSLDVFTEYGITRNPKRSYLHPNALVIQEDRWQLLSAVEMYVLGTPYCIARANCSGDNFIYAPTGLECSCACVVASLDWQPLHTLHRKASVHRKPRSKPWAVRFLSMMGAAPGLPQSPAAFMCLRMAPHAELMCPA